MDLIWSKEKKSSFYQLNEILRIKEVIWRHVHEAKFLCCDFVPDAGLEKDFDEMLPNAGSTINVLLKEHVVITLASA